MRNKKLRIVALFISLFLVCGLLQPVNSMAQVVEDETNEDTGYLLFTLLAAPQKGKAHKGPLDENAGPEFIEFWQKAWKDLKITVKNENGEIFESPNEYIYGYDPSDPSSFEDLRGTQPLRYVGKFKDGERITVTVDPSTIPDGYHMVEDKDDAIYAKEGNYTFEFLYKKGPAEYRNGNMTVKISMGMMDVGFDPNGGTIDGNDEVLKRPVKQNNAIEFPSEPIKDNLVFWGWYTQYPSRDEFMNMGWGSWASVANGKVFWTDTKKYTDYDHDWMPYNSPKIDPLHDGLFLMRAAWKAKIKFITNNNTEIKPLYLYENEKLSEPEKLQKAFAKFIEWQKDGQTYDFTSPVTANMTLTAKWDDYTPVPQNVTLTQGEAFNPKDGIKNLVDMPEGTTVQAKADVSTENYGEQTVTLVVEAPNENGTIDTKEVEITLTVNPRPLEINHAPQLEVVDKTITAGDELDLKTLITQASDLEDGDDLTDKVEISSETFDNSKPGEYEISFTLTDSAGAKVTKNAKVTVEPKTYTITYDLAEGSLNGQTGIIKTVVEEGATIVLPEPSREGYTLEYWQGSQYQPGDSYVVTEEHTFTAIWKAIEKPTEPSDTTAPSKPGDTTEPTTKPSDTTAPTEPRNTTAPTKPSATTKPTADNSVPQAGESNTAIVYGLLLIAGASVAIILRRKENKAK
jgi:Rib/alpha/Esp surface antigen-like repeat protein